MKSIRSIDTKIPFFIFLLVIIKIKMEFFVENVDTLKHKTSFSNGKTRHKERHRASLFSKVHESSSSNTVSIYFQQLT